MKYELLGCTTSNKLSMRDMLMISFAFVLLLFPFVPAYGIDFTGGLANLAKEAPNVIRFIAACAYVTGFWFIYSAVQQLRIYGNARTMMPTHIAFTEPLLRFAIGIMMIYLPTIIKVLTYSLWATGGDFTYTPAAAGSFWQQIIDSCIQIVRVVGYISFVRGLIVMSRASRQGVPPGMVGKGMMHIIGGILAINIDSTVLLIEKTFGFNFR